MTTTPGAHVVPIEPAHLPELAAADRGVAEALTSVLSDNTRRTYTTQWRIFTGWCAEMGLRSLPAEPLTVARYLAARAGSGAAVATLRLATSAISKTREWAKLKSPRRDPGVRASLKGWGRRLSKPQRQSGALTAGVLAVIRLAAVQPRKRGRGIETLEQAAERGKFDVALVAVLSETCGPTISWRILPSTSPIGAARDCATTGAGSTAFRRSATPTLPGSSTWRTIWHPAA